MQIQKTVLQNRLTAVTIPLRGRGACAIGVWVNVGGRDEEKRLNGVSHFLEHLVFKGTQKRSMRRIKEEIEGKGGGLNAFTSEESTCFYAKVPQANFSTALDVLSDLVTGASLTQADIDKERTVVIEEIKMVHDQPSHYVEEMLDAMFWKDHPLGRPLTGTIESVKGLTRSDIVSYRDRFYAPRNITVIASGDVDHAQLLRFCKSAFKPEPGAPKPAPRRPAAPHADFRLVTKKIEQVNLCLAVPGYPQGHPNQYKLTLMNVILGANMSSRLFHEVREERGLAYEISSGVKKFKDTGCFVVDAGIDPSKTGEALKEILRQCTLLAKKGVSAAELKRAKEYYEGQFIIGLEGTMELMMWVGEELNSAGRVRKLDEIRADVSRIRPEDIRKTAQDIFRESALQCALLGPLPEEKSASLRRLLAFG